MAKRKFIIELTRRELELLNHALLAGISGDSIDQIGLSKREQTTLSRVGNHLLDLADSKATRYQE